MTMTTPTRIQRKRVKGWRMPEGARYVGRGTQWGNPYAVKEFRRTVPSMRFVVWREDWDNPVDYFGNQALAHSFAVEMFRAYATERLEGEPDWLDPLRDAKYLSCWCRPLVRCHADILIEFLQETEQTT